MAFSPEYKVAHLDSFKRICSTQAVVEARLSPPSGVNIAQILSLTCDVTALPTETFAGEVRYSGQVKFRILYVDSQGGFDAMEHTADFTDKITDSAIVASMRPMLGAVILDTDTVNVSASEVKLASVVEVTLDCVDHSELHYLAGGGQDIFTQETQLEHSHCLVESTDSFAIIDTISDQKLVRLLGCDGALTQTGIRTAAGVVTVQGAVVLNLIGVTEAGTLTSATHSIPLSQELPATGADDQCTAYVNLMLKSLSATQSEGSNAVNIEAFVTASYAVFQPQQLTVVCDAFSVTNELFATIQSVPLGRLQQSAHAEERVEGNIALDDKLPLADAITAVTAHKLTLTAARPSDGQLTLEGVASAIVIYSNAETNSLNPVSAELPFSINLDAPATASDAIYARGVVSAASARIRRANEIDIKLDISITVDICQSTTVPVMTELRLGEARAIPSSAISIYVTTPDQSLWDVAKALGVTPDSILAQNPTLVLPLRGGERIMTYRHRMS